MFIKEIKIYRDDVNAEWDVLRKIVKKHPELFPKEKANDEAFSWCTNTLLTRCFGIGLNFTMLVPFAD